MPISSSFNHIKELVDGTALSASKNFVFEGLEFDTREIRGGELFVALPGLKNHGNDFVEVALERGASMVIAERAVALPELVSRERILLVDDSLKALWTIAAWWRDQVKLPTFAVTGSVGKTTVKEMTAAILLQKGIGTYSLKSHNNHIGVPYTICRTSKNHSWLVLEIGMNHRGEIAPLSELAKPKVAAVTNVAPAHIGYLGSLEAIADEKLDIIAGLDKSGHLLLNAQSSVLCEKAKIGAVDQKVSVDFFGSSILSDGAISNISSRGLAGISFNLRLGQEDQTVNMKVLGKQNAWNAACAALAAKIICPEITPQEIVSGLEKFSAPLMRLNIRYLSDASVVIDDSYNANPASMAAAIELLIDLRATQQKVGLVIGDMLELGDFSLQYHKEIGKIIEDVKPNFVIAVGEAALSYVENLKQSQVSFRHCLNDFEASKAIDEFEFDFLLVKASRGIGLDKVVNHLIESIGELPYEPQLVSEADMASLDKCSE